MKRRIYRPVRLARRERGYTLIEVLIALALVALLSTGLVSGISTGTRVWEKANSLSIATSTASAADTILRHHISMIVPVTATVSGGRAGSSFEGRAERLEFLTGAGLGPVSHGVYAVIFEIRGDEPDTLVIRRTRRPITAMADGSPPGWEEEEIDLDRSGARFIYYERPLRGSANGWRSDWLDRRQLPDLIGLTYAAGIADPDKAAIIIAPQIDQALGRVDAALLSRIFSAGGGG